MSELSFKPLVPAEGWAVLHLFYRVNRAVWEAIPSEARLRGLARLQSVVQEASGWEKFRVITFSVLARADLGFMIVGPDLHQVNELEKRISRALGADVLEPVYSYFSLTEKSEYTSSEQEYVEDLEKKEGLKRGSPEMEARLVSIRERIHGYTHDRMYPTLPDWEYFCFYPMSKKRAHGQNWYALEFEKRKELMGGHARVGRTFAGRVRQLITGSTGLDDWEWGVTLFAHDPVDIKAIVYEMRFDEVSHGYAEFGPFYNGLAMNLTDIYRRLGLADQPNHE